MKHKLALLALLASLGGATLAGEYRIGDLVVKDAWARELPPVSANGAAWFRVVNHGAADRIVSVSSPASERAELHTHEMEDGVAKMRHLPAIEVPANGDLVFEPGSRHVMLVGLEEALVAGDSFPMTIRFEQAGEMELQVQIRSSEVAGHDGLSGHSGQPEGSDNLLESGGSPEALA